MSGFATALKLYGLLILLAIGIWALCAGYRTRFGRAGIAAEDGGRAVRRADPAAALWLLSLVPTTVIVVDLVSFHDIERPSVLLTGSAIAVGAGLAAWLARRAIAARTPGADNGARLGLLASLGVMGIGLMLMRALLPAP